MMRARGTWKQGYASQWDDGRGHRVCVDLSKEEGGKDLGASALELSVISLGGCIMTHFALVAERRKLEFKSVLIDLEAARPPGARTITSVGGVLRVVTAAPMEEVETTLRLTLRTCPLGVLFEQANIPIRVRPVVVALPPVTGRPMGLTA